MAATKPYFSVVIPTRNRPRYLRFALQSVLRSKFTDIEVLVSDNSDAAETRSVLDVIDSSDDERVRYIRPERAPLSMSAHWHFALQHIRGSKTVVIGDDDGLMPSSLAAIHKIFASTDSQVVRWPFAKYVWDDFPDASLRNLLIVPVHAGDPSLRGLFVQATERLADPRLWQHHELLPMLYNSAVATDLVRTLFGGKRNSLISESPDIYSGFCIAYAVERFWESAQPLSVAGASGASNGARMLLGDASDSITSDFKRLNDSSGTLWHPSVPDVGEVPACVAECLAHYLDQHPRSRRYGMSVSEVKWIELLVNSILKGMASPPNQRRKLESLAQWLQNNNPELAGMVAKAISTIPCATDRCEQTGHRFRCGVRTDEIRLDGRIARISNVSDAAALAEAVLALDQATAGSVFSTTVAPQNKAGALRQCLRDVCPPVLRKLWLRIKRWRE